MTLTDKLRHQAKMTEESPAYPGADPDTLRAAANEIERLSDRVVKLERAVCDVTEYLDGWRARAQVSEALLTDLEMQGTGWRTG